MKKLLTIIALTASASMLNADYNGSYGYGDSNYGGCSGNQGPYQQGQYGQYGQNQGSSSPWQYSQNQQGYGYGQSGGTAIQNDQQLTSKIQDSIRSAFSNKYNNVNVSVNNGNVTLTGTVASQDDKNNLEQKIRGMPGVQNVTNQVTVQTQAQ